MLTNQITSMIAVFGLSQIVKNYSSLFQYLIVFQLRRYDLTTDKAVFYIRILYYTSQVLQILAWLYIRYLIQKKGKKEERTTMIEVIEPAKPFSSEPPKKTRISIYDYDLAEVKKNLNQVLSGLVIMSGLHFWFKFTQPLIFQSLLPWKNFFTMSVVQIRLFGFKAEGSLARPWKAPNPFGDLMGQMDESAAQEKKEITCEKSEGEEEEEKAPEIKVKSSGAGVKSRKPRKEE